MKRCFVIPGDVDIGMAIKKKLDALTMTIPGCKMKRCVVIDVESIDIGMSIKKELDALMMTIR